MINFNGILRNYFSGLMLIMTMGILLICWGHVARINVAVIGFFEKQLMAHSADINQDCKVDYLDLSLLEKYWLNVCQPTNGECHSSDLNQNGSVGLDDLMVLSSKWLSSPSLTKNSFYGDASTLDSITGGSFCVWWDKNYDYSSEAANVLAGLMDAKAIAENEFGMRLPTISLCSGFYVNVYLHNNGPDLFPDGWSLGLGTDPQGFPALTIPFNIGQDPPGPNGNAWAVTHEAFHLYQWDDESFPYEGDTAWYIEATANWFVHYVYPTDLIGKQDIPAFTINPQLKLWADVFNQINHPTPWDVISWSRATHNYGAQAFFIYITDNNILPGSVIGKSFNLTNPPETPQQYLYDQMTLAGYDMKEVYADFAARNITLDYPFNGYVQGEENFWANEQSNDDNRIVLTLNNTGTGGWVRVPKDSGPAGMGTYAHYPNAWAYNTYKINNSSTGSYTFELDGLPDNQAKFRGRIVVRDGNNRTYYNLDMSNQQDGRLTVNVNATDEEIYFVVAVVPDTVWTGNTFYDYSIRITK